MAVISSQLSLPQKLLLVNTRERNGSGSAGEKTGARGTMGRGTLPDNIFKLAPDFRGRLGLVISYINTEQDGETFTATTAASFLSFRATVSIDERKQ